MLDAIRFPKADITELYEHRLDYREQKQYMLGTVLPYVVAYLN